MRVEYDRESGKIIGGPFSNEQPFKTEDELNAFLESLGDMNRFPKCALWGSISPIGLRTCVCPVFCIPTPLTQGVTSEFLTGFVDDIMQKAEDAGCQIFAISTDGDPRWRAYAKRNLKKPNYPANRLYAEILHRDANYFSPFYGPLALCVVNDAEHLYKVGRNQLSNKILIIGDFAINMFWLEEVRVDDELRGLHKLSISDTNVQVRLLWCFEWDAKRLQPWVLLYVMYKLLIITYNKPSTSILLGPSEG